MNIVEGDLLSLQEGILVHGCNCIGAMGAGVALHIRNRWPSVYRAYVQKHRRESLHLGDIQVVAAPSWGPGVGSLRSVPLNTDADELPPALLVVNAMTQDGIRIRKSPGELAVDYDAISAVFARIRLLARETGLSVHFPLIGCGLAGGKWSEVKPRIEVALGHDVDATLWVLPGTDVSAL